MSDGPKIEIKASAELKADVPPDVQRGVVDFAKRILGPLAELGDLASDWIRLKRFQQSIWIMQRAKEICAEAGVDPQQIPLSVSVPLLEKASLEEDGDESLRERWATLLANAAMAPSKRYARYVTLLGEISVYEAQILSELKNQVNRHELFKPDVMNALLVGAEQPVTWDGGVIQNLDELKADGRLSFHWHGDDIPNTEEFSLADLAEIVPLMHLHQLGLLKVRAGSFHRPPADERIFYVCGDLTPLGFDFVSACERPEE